MLVENRDFSYLPCMTAPLGGPCPNIAITSGTKIPGWCGYPTVKKNLEDICLAVSTEYQSVTDGQTSCDSIVCIMHGIAR